MSEQQVANREPSTEAAALLPPVDIYEDTDGITVTADLPGVSKDRLHVHVEDDILHIEGEAEFEIPADLQALYAEVQTPRYRRSFTLSRELEVEKVDAKLNDGVLTVHIPRSEAAKPRRIEVKVG